MLRAALAGAGLDRGTLLVVPTLSEAGAPVVHASLTAAGVFRLAHWLDSGAGPPAQASYQPP